MIQFTNWTSVNKKMNEKHNAKKKQANYYGVAMMEMARQLGHADKETRDWMDKLTNKNLLK